MYSSWWQRSSLLAENHKKWKKIKTPLNSFEILTQGAKQLLGHPPVPTLPEETNARKDTDAKLMKSTLGSPC